MSILPQQKAVLDTLTQQVADAQNEVDECQAIVDLLREKAVNSQSLLAEAENNKTQALSNQNLTDRLVQNVLDLQNNSKIADDEMTAADDKTKELAKAIRVLMYKMIRSAEVINKLAIEIIKKKALNPLVSDELVSLVTAAGTDANNAVTLTLLALKTTFMATALNIESGSAVKLENSQATELNQALTGDIPGEKSAPSLKALIYKACDDAKAYYKKIEKAHELITRELAAAMSDLIAAQVKLKSLQAGLVAANAAALAS